MLTEAIIFRILNRQNAKQFSFQLNSQVWVFDDVMFLICSNMNPIYVFIGDRNCIADKKYGFCRGSSYMVIAGTNIPLRKVQIKIQPFLLLRITVI